MYKAPPRFELGISCLLDRRFNQLGHGALSIHKCKRHCKSNTCVTKLGTKSWSPNVGLEPTTLRLRVSCSTD